MLSTPPWRLDLVSSTRRFALHSSSATACTQVAHLSELTQGMCDTGSNAGAGSLCFTTKVPMIAAARSTQERSCCLSRQPYTLHHLMVCRGKIAVESRRTGPNRTLQPPRGVKRTLSSLAVPAALLCSAGARAHLAIMLGGIGLAQGRGCSQHGRLYIPHPHRRSICKTRQEVSTCHALQC